ncbi:MAG: hypothetical protein QW548_00780 [Candidatus Aenigmatarchaeota archaeon]
MEGLPLKYIVIVLVAALVIGAVVAITTGFIGTAQSGASQLNQTFGAGVSKSAQQACEALGCMWNATNQTCVC